MTDTDLNWREGLVLRGNSTYQKLKEAFQKDDEDFDNVLLALDDFINMVEGS